MSIDKQEELLVWDRSGVSAYIRTHFLNLHISKISRPVVIKVYLKYYLGRGKAALDFTADRVRTLVSMATDSYHMVIKE